MNKILVLFFALVSSSAFATTWYVAKSGKDTNMGKSEGTAFLTIQKAVDSASDGDLILVGSGVYSPTSISKNGVVNSNKKIIIKSLNGYKDTIIDAQNKMCCLYDGGNYNYTNCTLIGFSLINGRAPSNFNMGGGAIGGRLVNCVISNCYALANAGGAHFTRMENCLILACNAPEGYASAAYSCELRNCTVTQNRLEGSLAGGQCALYECAVYNTIVYDNPSGGLGPGCSAHNCVTSDPKFRDAAHGDYRLQKSSPCIDAGDNSYSTTDTDLAGKVRIYNGKVDIGAYEYQPDVFGGIRNIVAKQRYPWNGLVDFSFEVTGDPATAYKTSFLAHDHVSATNIPSRTIYASDGSRLSVTNSLKPGVYRWIWNALADLPNGFVSERMTIAGNAEQSQGLYMVIDLSSGANSSKYPVSYLDAVPSGGWSDEYKTTKLVLRRCESGAFKMQNSSKVMLTKPFYIGVFEVTQKQYMFVMGTNPVPVNNKWCYGEKCPIFFVSYSTIRGSNKGGQWPSSSDVDPSSFLGRLQVRTSMKFDLPTEAQWEYACRAGTNSVYYWGDSMNGDYCWWSDNCDRAQVVGLKRPNGWGLYDMAGNAWEFCLDWYGNLSYGTDPKGAMSNSLSRRVRRGGDWQTSEEDVFKPISSYSRDYDSSSWSGDDDGFRLCLTLSN